MIIRAEEEKDFKEIYELIKNGFLSLEYSDGEEQELVERIRRGQNYIPELALVAEKDNQLIGFIMLSKINVQEDTASHEILLLAPLVVKPEYRNLGVGGSLIRESLKRGKELGYSAVTLIGIPEYYPKFGFQLAEPNGLHSKMEVPTEAFMIHELKDGALKDIKGEIDFNI